MAGLSVLLKLVEKRELGPSPAFGREHTLLAFLTVGEADGIGRHALALRSGLGEGSIRTVLKKLRQAGYVKVDTVGCHLTEAGKKVHESILKKMVPPTTLQSSNLTVGRSQAAVLLRSAAGSVASGIEQRDSAVRMGAAGATTYTMEGGKFTIPGGSTDCERDFPDEVWPTLRAALEPKNDDVVIVCGAHEDKKAKLGALSAALTLL
jgi:hypothetical protein